MDGKGEGREGENGGEGRGERGRKNKNVRKPLTSCAPSRSQPFSESENGILNTREGQLTESLSAYRGALMIGLCTAPMPIYLLQSGPVTPKNGGYTISPLKKRTEK